MSECLMNDALDHQFDRSACRPCEALFQPRIERDFCGEQFGYIGYCQRNWNIDAFCSSFKRYCNP